MFVGESGYGSGLSLLDIKIITFLMLSSAALYIIIGSLAYFM